MLIVTNTNVNYHMIYLIYMYTIFYKNIWKINIQYQSLNRSNKKWFTLLYI